MGRFNAKMILAALAPGQCQYPVDIGAQCRDLSRLRGSTLKAINLFAHPGRYLSGHDLFTQFGAQIVGLGGSVDAQFLLDGPQLLAQVKFFLRAINLGTDTGAYRRFEFKNLDLIAHNHADFFQACQWVQRLQEFLLLLRICHEVGGEHI